MPVPHRQVTRSQRARRHRLADVLLLRQPRDIQFRPWIARPVSPLQSNPTPGVVPPHRYGTPWVSACRTARPPRHWGPRPCCRRATAPPPHHRTSPGRAARPRLPSDHALPQPPGEQADPELHLPEPGRNLRSRPIPGAVKPGVRVRSEGLPGLLVEFGAQFVDDGRTPRRSRAVPRSAVTAPLPARRDVEPAAAARLEAVDDRLQPCPGPSHGRVCPAGCGTQRLLPARPGPPLAPVLRQRRPAAMAALMLHQPPDTRSTSARERGGDIRQGGLRPIQCGRGGVVAGPDAADQISQLVQRRGRRDARCVHGCTCGSS